MIILTVHMSYTLFSQRNRKKRTRPKAIGPHSGASTHHHDQVITSVNFSVINTIVSIPKKSIPLELEEFVFDIVIYLNSGGYAWNRTKIRSMSNSFRDCSRSIRVYISNRKEVSKFVDIGDTVTNDNQYPSANLNQSGQGKRI